MRILFILLPLAFLTSVNAQKHEISINYSPLSIYQLEKMVEGTSPDQHNYKVLGAINIDYYRYMNSWLKIGFSLMYDQASIEGYGTSGYYIPSSLTNEPYKSSKRAIVISPQIDFEYLRNNKFKLSSGIAIGYGTEHFSTEGGINYNADLDGFTFHINLISFRLGTKHGLCGSIGAGYKGFANLGYFVRF